MGFPTQNFPLSADPGSMTNPVKRGGKISNEYASRKKKIVGSEILRNNVAEVKNL